MLAFLYEPCIEELSNIIGGHVAVLCPYVVLLLSYRPMGRIHIKSMFNDVLANAWYFVRLEGERITVFHKELNETLANFIGYVAPDLYHARVVIVC